MTDHTLPFDPAKPLEMRCVRWADYRYSPHPPEYWRTVELVKVLGKRPCALVWDGDDKDRIEKLIEVPLKYLRNVGTP